MNTKNFIVQQISTAVNQRSFAYTRCDNTKTTGNVRSLAPILLLVVFLFMALLIVPLSATAESDITALANTTSDENGNYTFTNLPAGDYIISAAHYIPAMYAWCVGSRYINVGDGEDLADIDVWLSFGSESEADAILNANIDPSGLTGTSSISGVILGAGKYGIGEAPKVNATVIISSYLKGDLSGDDLLAPADALIALQMAVGTREPDLRGDMNFDGIVTSLDALMILQAV